MDGWNHRTTAQSLVSQLVQYHGSPIMGGRAFKLSGLDDVVCVCAL